MSEVDLNLSNYSLIDILKLFKLENGLTEEGMKKAKRQVLMTHPDKSNLTREYFLFFSSAYKLLYKVYQYHERNKEDTSIKRRYSSVDIDDQQEYREVWNILSKHNNFNEVFNELFDELILTDKKNDGYGDWFKEQEEYIHAANIEEMNTIIAEKKKNLSSVVLFKEMNDIGGNLGSSLLEKEDTYQTGLFSTLPYEDLKQAYTETVVPVTEEDYYNHPKYSSIDQLQRTRQRDLQEGMAHANHAKTLRDQRTQDENNDMERIYCLVKQDEEIQKKTNKIVSKLLRITQ